MKKILAYLVILLFIGSAVLQVYSGIRSNNIVLSAIDDNDDEEAGKEFQKETEFAKDKICFCYNNWQLTGIPVTGSFIITNSYLLPHPFIAAEINPPNTAEIL
jgi:hypothetical protein